MRACLMFFKKMKTRKQAGSYCTSHSFREIKLSIRMYETQCVLIKTNAYFVIYQSPLFYLSGEITVLEIGNALNLFAILTTDNIHDRFFREKVSNTIVATKYRYACYYIDKLNKYTFICIIVILIFLFIEPEARDI